MVLFPVFVIYFVVVKFINVEGVVVTYAVEHRGEIEPKIIRILNVLYPQEKVEKPYRAGK